MLGRVSVTKLHRMAGRGWLFLASLPLAASLIALTGTLVICGGLVPQILEAFWFRGLLVLLIMSTLFCTLRRTRRLWRHISRPTAHFFPALGTLITHLAVVALLPAAWIALTRDWQEREIVLMPGEQHALARRPDLAIQYRTMHTSDERQGFAADVTIWADGRCAVTRSIHFGAPLHYRGIAFHVWAYGPAIGVQAEAADGRKVRLCPTGGTCADGQIFLPQYQWGSGVFQVELPAFQCRVLIVPDAGGYLVRTWLGEARSSAQETHVAADGELSLAGLRLRFTPTQYGVFKASALPGATAVWFAALVMTVGMGMSIYFPLERRQRRAALGGQDAPAASEHSTIEAQPFSYRWDQAVVVESVAMEYQHLAGQRCACGGRYRVQMQSLHEREGRYYDVLQARCLHCGAERTFVFDIHRFFP